MKLKKIKIKAFTLLFVNNKIVDTTKLKLINNVKYKRNRAVKRSCNAEGP